MQQVQSGDPERQSKDLVATNVDQVKKLFPAAFTDGRIDFDVLKQLLGESIDEDKERYGLNWHGKRRARRIALTPSMGTLVPCPQDSVDWDTTQNLVIEGDNLEVLKLLQNSYAHEVKLIYIDPPYNTGKDFVYPDRFGEGVRTYLELTGQLDGEGGRWSSNPDSSGRFHSAWLNMIYPRLMLARNLLTDDGVIVISIDEREYAHLRTVCCELFGEENIVGTMVWKNATDNNPTRIAVEHEYLLFVARDATALEKVWKSSVSDIRDLLVKVGNDINDEYAESEIANAYAKWYREHKSELWPLDRYKYIDKGGVYTGSQSVHNPGKEGYRYDVIHPVTNKPCKQPLMGYRFPKATMDRLLDEGKILFGENESKIIELKVYASEYQEKLSSVLELDGRLGAYDLRDDFPDEGKVFSNPKPVRLLHAFIPHILKHEGDMILDFFAGSGATAKAVYELNDRDSVQRRFMLVQLPEPLDASSSEGKAATALCRSLGKPEVISEVTRERVRRASQKAAVGTGFRAFTFGRSNLNKWDTSRQDPEQQILEVVDNIIDGRTEQDLLYELLLSRGLDLSLSIDTRTFGGVDVFSTGHGVLFACLPAADAITKDNVEAIAHGIADWRKELDPAGEVSVYFKDMAFRDDVAKANMAAILAQHGFPVVKSL